MTSSKFKKGREVLAHPTTREAATPVCPQTPHLKLEGTTIPNIPPAPSLPRPEDSKTAATEEPTQLTLPDMPKPEHDTGPYTERQIEQGKATYRDASEWRKSNTQAWQFVVQVAKQAAAQRKRIGGRDLIEQVRRKGFSTVSGTPTVTNNSYAPIFTRWLIIEHPETAPYIERRKTVFDFLVTSYA